MTGSRYITGPALSPRPLDVSLEARPPDTLHCSPAHTRHSTVTRVEDLKELRSQFLWNEDSLLTEDNLVMNSDFIPHLVEFSDTFRPMERVMLSLKLILNLECRISSHIG